MTPAFRIARSSSCRVRAWPAVRLGGPRVLSHGPPRRDPAVRERLRAVIRRIEETGPGWTGGESAALSLGVGEIDAHLPWGGLPAGALHEIVAADTGAVGAASAFSAYLAALAGDGPVLWCEGARVLDAGIPHPPGLRRFGLEPERLIAARTGKDAETLRTMEDGLRCGALAAAVGVLAAVSLTESRRLQRAARESGVTALILRPPGAGAAPNAATTRWRIAAVPGAAPGWRLEMLRCRGGLPGDWTVEWNDETCGLALAAALCDRQAGADRQAA